MENIKHLDFRKVRLSSDYVEPPVVRESTAASRELLFALLDLGVEINAIGQAAAPLIGINQTDLICLNVLFRRGPLSAGALASAVGLTTGAITTVVDRLERAGYVRRTGDPGDRRRVLVEASQEGALRAFSLFDGLLDDLATFAAAQPSGDVELLLRMLGAFADLVVRHAAALRARAGEARTPRP